MEITNDSLSKTYTREKTTEGAASVILAAVQLNLADLSLGSIARLVELLDGGIGQLNGLLFCVVRNAPSRVQLRSCEAGSPGGGLRLVLEVSEGRCAAKGIA